MRPEDSDPTHTLVREEPLRVGAIAAQRHRGVGRTGAGWDPDRQDGQLAHRLAEDGSFAGRTVTLIEDIVTTGGAVRSAVIALRELGGHVHNVVCAIDRSEPGQNQLTEVGVTTISVLTKDDLDRAGT